MAERQKMTNRTIIGLYWKLEKLWREREKYYVRLWAQCRRTVMSIVWEKRQRWRARGKEERFQKTEKNKEPDDRD